MYPVFVPFINVFCAMRELDKQIALDTRHQLELLIASLTVVHTNGGQPEPLTHHARAMVQVVRVLHLQVDTYRERLSVQSPSEEPKPRRRLNVASAP